MGFPVGLLYYVLRIVAIGWGEEEYFFAMRLLKINEKENPWQVLNCNCNFKF
jgi:hypothetical protein